jgi:hypothetical protein
MAIVPIHTVFIFLSSLKNFNLINIKPVVQFIGHGFSKIPSLPYHQAGASATRLSQVPGIRGFPSHDYSWFGFIGGLYLICFRN